MFMKFMYKNKRNILVLDTW